MTFNHTLQSGPPHAQEPRGNGDNHVVCRQGAFREGGPKLDRSHVMQIVGGGWQCRACPFYATALTAVAAHVVRHQHGDCP